MTATLTMVPLAKIRARKGFNPRTEFADEQMAELVESVRRHGIVTPLTLAPDSRGGFTVIAGERRYRAAKAAKLRQVPAQVRDADGEALTLAVAENVIRADLSPVEEAHAYRRLVDERRRCVPSHLRRQQMLREYCGLTWDAARRCSSEKRWRRPLPPTARQSTPPCHGSFAASRGYTRDHSRHRFSCKSGWSRPP